MCILRRPAGCSVENEGPAGRQANRVQVEVLAGGKGRAGIPIRPTAQTKNLGLIPDFCLSLSPTSNPLKIPVGFIFKIYPESDHVSPP